MIFLTVGTEYPFDRLVLTIDTAVASGKLWDDVFAQIGKGEYTPKHMEWARMLPTDEFDRRMRDCRAIISHAGMGTIISSIDLKKPLLVIPRRSEYGEHVNDHQLSTARKFRHRGDLLVVFDLEDLETAITGLENFQPAFMAHGPDAIIRFVGDYLASLDRAT